MEINTNISAIGVNRPVPPKRSETAKTGLDATSFDNSAAVESTLKNLPESRPEAVERARNLLSSVNYPPEETIRKLSHLLAIKLESSES